MTVYFLQHVAAEGPGNLQCLLEQQGYDCRVLHIYQQATFPSLQKGDWLVVMGGPMGVYDEQQYPWLAGEKQFVAAAIDRGHSVIGICLGAQLIAHVLGAEISRNPHKEIGWFPVKKHPALSGTQLDSALPDEFMAFHWHGDTFAIPEGAIPMASSEACTNQGFVMDRRIFAFQFHPEISRELVQAFVDVAEDELDGGAYVQSVESMLAESNAFDSSYCILKEIISIITAGSSP